MNRQVRNELITQPRTESESRKFKEHFTQTQIHREEDTMKAMYTKLVWTKFGRYAYEEHESVAQGWETHIQGQRTNCTNQKNHHFGVMRSEE